MPQTDNYYYYVTYQANLNELSLTGASYITRTEEIRSFQHIADLREYLEEYNGYKNLVILNFIRMEKGFDKDTEVDDEETNE
jgi:hypothetical protein